MRRFWRRQKRRCAQWPFQDDSLAGRSVYLQKHSPFGQWVTIAKLKLGPLGGRIFTIPHQKGTVYYRVYMTTNQAGLGYLDTWSNASKVTFTK